MITCTGCGRKNPDDARCCEGCGRKLQSGRFGAPQESGGTRPLERFSSGSMSDAARSELWRMVEAWGYVAVVLAALGACLYTGRLWPLYPAVAVVALLLWLRKI
ncbi:zinc ribbon domain-containing protein [Pseudodesulfovibrio tunisiensis]|uniref:zinc ribbon domain-containing protein n=1 Tax=Pseudodesulfovibrio tunisiensis TaxID=463192 RepID=UPI001FB3891C|nr:zinc ribbon domain-containing protein [Pseudodesulfovibrio tunisiensis]